MIEAVNRKSSSPSSVQLFIFVSDIREAQVVQIEDAIHQCSTKDN